MSSEAFKYDSESGEIPLEHNSTGPKSSGMVADAFEKVFFHTMTRATPVSRKSTAILSVTA